MFVDISYDLLNVFVPMSCVMLIYPKAYKMCLYCIVSNGILCFPTPLHDIACYCVVGLGARAVSRKTPMTQCKMEVRILSGGVTKNLTLHGMSKIDFQPDFRNALMLSFLMMYNTMGSKVDGLAVREHFLSKSASKSPILAARFSDHLTLEGASTHNFKDYDLFHGCFEKYGPFAFR